MKTTTKEDLLNIEVNEPIYVTPNFYLHVGPSQIYNSETYDLGRQAS